MTGGVSEGQSLNRYAYANGNPVSYLDPFGLSRDEDNWFDNLLDGILGLFNQGTGETGSNHQGWGQKALENANRAFQWLDDAGNALMIANPIPNSGYPVTFLDDSAGGVIAAIGKIGKFFTKVDDIPWSSSSVASSANKLLKGTKEVTVSSKSEAEEIFLGLYQGKGYKNVTGMNATSSKNLLGSKKGTYHWDAGHSGGNPHDIPHLQIHDEAGNVLRIFYNN